MPAELILELHLAHGRVPRKQEPGRATQGGGAFTQVCGELALWSKPAVDLGSPQRPAPLSGCENKGACPLASSERSTRAFWVPAAACVVRLWVWKAVCLRL